MQTIVAALLFPAGDLPGRVMEIAPWLDARFEPIEVLITNVTHELSQYIHRGTLTFPQQVYAVLAYR